jgi:hypothetical protein
LTRVRAANPPVAAAREPRGVSGLSATKLEARPTAMPGSVITSGRSWCSRSITARTRTAVANAIRTMARGVGPRVTAIPIHKRPFAISTAG